MTKNFKVRLSVSILLLIIAGVCLFTFDGIPFKIFFIAFALISILELLSFFKRKTTILATIFALIEVCLLFFASVFVSKISVLEIILLIFAVCGYDVFAYLFGNLLGGQIFGESRPFPHISKNKTWEGTLLGLITSFDLVGLLLVFTNSNHYIFFIAGLLALVGDLFESFMKRRFGIKDSNEIVIKKPLFAKLELLVGGSEGHGGYLDRIDSMAFTATILLVFSIL